MRGESPIVTSRPILLELSEVIRNHEEKEAGKMSGGQKSAGWLAVGLLVLSGCGGKSYMSDGKIDQEMNEQLNAGRYILVNGIGAPAKDVETMAQRKGTSRNAATVDAQFRLASQVKGLRITGGVTVEKAMETDSKISTTVDAMLKGAELVKTEWDKEDGCVVQMRLDKKKLAKELGVQFEE